MALVGPVNAGKSSLFNRLLQRERALVAPEPGTTRDYLEAEVWPTVVQAGEPFTLTVRVTNDAGSVIQEINSFVDVEVQNASTQDPGQGTLLNTHFQLLQGQRSISETYTFVESIVLVVTDEAGNAPAVTDVIEILPETSITFLKLVPLVGG